jgi:hypothetical protein
MFFKIYRGINLYICVLNHCYQSLLKYFLPIYSNIFVLTKFMFHLQIHCIMNIVPIRDLEPRQSGIKIRVRVCRIWRPKIVKSDGKFDGLHCIVVDAMVKNSLSYIKLCKTITQTFIMFFY